MSSCACVDGAVLVSHAAKKEIVQGGIGLGILAFGKRRYGDEGTRMELLWSCLLA